MDYRDELKLVVTAEVDKAIRDLNLYNKTTQKSETTTEAFAKAASIMKRTLATAGLGVSVAMITRELNLFAQKASEAEETGSKFAVVYGNIADQADRIAASYANAFGVAISTSKTLLGNVGDLLTGMGATQAQALELADQVTTFGSDLASFSNYAGGSAGAVDALTKMMLGEREMVKSLGIVIREADVQQRLFEKGQQDLTGQAKLLATAQASLELAMEQSKNAIGDYARTADSTANTNRRFDETLKESQELIGQYVNNGVTPLKAGLADIITAFNEAAKAKLGFDIALETGEGAADYIDDAREKAEGALERLGSKIFQWAQRTADPLGGSIALMNDFQAVEDLNTLQGYISDELDYQAALEEKKLLTQHKQQKQAQELSEEYKKWAEFQKSIFADQSISDFTSQPVSLPGIYSDEEVLDAQLSALESAIGSVWSGKGDFGNLAEWQTALDDLIASYRSVQDQIAQVEQNEAEISRIAELRASILTDEEKKQKQRAALEKELSGYFLSGLISLQEREAILEAFDGKDAFSLVTDDLEAEISAVDRTTQAYQHLIGEGEDLSSVYDAAGEKSALVTRAFQELASSTDISAEKLAEFLELYGQWIDTNADAGDGFTSFTQQLEEYDWSEFSENLGKELGENLVSSLNSIFGEVGQMIGSGQIDGESLSGSIISQGTSLMAAAAGPYAPLVHLAGGVLEGLNSAIFETIKQAKEVDEALSRANDSLEDLFTNVLDLEQELADQRMEAIEDEMDLLEQNRDLRLEILKDQWERGQITGSEYFDQASQINADYAAQESSYENQQTLITGVEDVIDTLTEELEGLSGWTKFWTKSDEDLEERIASYNALLEDISGDPNGLTDEEIQDLAAKYKIDVPAAASGADFVTSGPQLLMVGDNAGGQERVQVTPISSPNIHGPQSSGDVHITITGDVYGIDDLYMKLDKAGSRLKKLGRVSA